MRIKKWEDALRAAVQAHIALAFDWPTNHCVGFARKCGIAITGSSPLPDLSLANEEEADAEIAKRGADLADAVSKLFKRIPPAHAQRGDLGIIEQKGVKILVVVVDSFCAAPGPRCLRFISRTKMTDAFRVD